MTTSKIPAGNRHYNQILNDPTLANFIREDFLIIDSMLYRRCAPSSIRPYRMVDGRYIRYMDFQLRREAIIRYLEQFT